MPRNMVTSSFEITGGDMVTAHMRALVSQYRGAARQAVQEEAEIEMTEAKRRTPVRTGNLRASGHVTMDEDEANATLSFGGPAAPYAVYVHENLEAFHPVGQAKFLESVINEAKPYYAQRIAQRILAIVNGTAQQESGGNEE